MEKINLELQANTKEAQKNVDDLNKKVKDTGRSARKAGKDLSAGMQIGNEAVRALDRYTGGLASKLVAVGKAAKLSGKAMKSALISTGIGALVVALGLVVEYWDEIGEALGFINKDLERQKALNDELLTSVDSQLSLLQKEQKYNEQRGIDNAENLEKQKQILIAKDAILKRSIKILETQLLQEQAAAKEVTTWDKINAGFQGFLFGYSKQVELLAKTASISTEEQKKINDLQGELNKLKSEELDLDLLLNPPAKRKKEKLKEKVDTTETDEKAKTIEEIAKLEDAYFQKQLDKQTQELNAVSDKYFGLIEKAKDFGISTKELEAQRKAEEDAINENYRLQAEQKEKERLQGIKDIQDEFKVLTDEERAIAKLEKEQADKIAELELLKATEDEKLAIVKHYELLKQGVKDKTAEQEKQLDRQVLNAKLNMAKQGFDLLADIAGKDSKTGKAMAIASATISGTLGVMNAFATANKSPITVAFPAYPYLQAGLAGAAALKNIASIKSVDPSGRGNTGTVPSPSGGGGGSAPTTESLPPAFNIVGASGTNQLADAIGGQTQQPTKAYVVASDVSTAQEMDRNIIEGASIG
jgi:hypothetical protein